MLEHILKSNLLSLICRIFLAIIGNGREAMQKAGLIHGLPLNQITFSLAKEGMFLHEIVYQAPTKNITDFKVPSDAYFCNGMPHSPSLNIEKDIYQPKITKFSRNIRNDGFHKIYQNDLTIAPFMNKNCSLKISEFVSHEIFFDKDELKRLKELNFEFDYAIDIEKPANMSQNHFVNYYLKLDDFEGQVSSANYIENGDLIIKWWFPFHLRYQLPDKVTNYTTQKDMTEFWLRAPEIYYKCENDKRFMPLEVQNFGEIANSDMQVSRWRKLHYDSGVEGDHYNVSAPVVPNKLSLQIGSSDIIEYETLSALVVICCIAIILFTALRKSA
jgi:hypothetical protein